MTGVPHERLPDWPRLMPEQIAVAYVGGVPSVLRDIGAIKRAFGRRWLYDRLDIDERLNARYGRVAEGPDATVYLDAL